jgi:hypothetical protein
MGCTACAGTFAIFKTSHINQMPLFVGFFASQNFFQQNAFWRTSTITNQGMYGKR